MKIVNMENLLNMFKDLFSELISNPEEVLLWVLIYFGISALAFIAIWIFGFLKKEEKIK